MTAFPVGRKTRPPPPPRSDREAPAKHGGPAPRPGLSAQGRQSARRSAIASAHGLRARPRGPAPRRPQASSLAGASRAGSVHEPVLAVVPGRGSVRPRRTAPRDRRAPRCVLPRPSGIWIARRIVEKTVRDHRRRRPLLPGCDQRRTRMIAPLLSSRGSVALLSRTGMRGSASSAARRSRRRWRRPPDEASRRARHDDRPCRALPGSGRRTSSARMRQASRAFSRPSRRGARHRRSRPMPAPTQTSPEHDAELRCQRNVSNAHGPEAHADHGDATCFGLSGTPTSSSRRACPEGHDEPTSAVTVPAGATNEDVVEHRLVVISAAPSTVMLSNRDVAACTTPSAAAKLVQVPRYVFGEHCRRRPRGRRERPVSCALRGSRSGRYDRSEYAVGWRTGRASSRS